MMSKTWKYLLITFVLAWALMIGSVFSWNPYLATGLTSLAMLAPLLAVIVVNRGVKREKTGVAWKLNLRRGWKWYLAAWWGPLLLTVVGGAFYFLLFPARFDAAMGYFTAAMPNYQAQAVPAPLLLAGQLASGMFLAPFINTFFALGEEAGWRGFLAPALSARFGRKKALFLTGIIWGVWHWPLILLAGYEYGTGYWGAPYTGMLCMLLFTTAFGILLSFLYERTDSIWSCALSHGALNAVAAAPLYFLPAGSASYLLGPTIAGPVAGLPMIALAAWALWGKRGKRGEMLDT